ncbi:MAG: ribosome maturation factor RimP [Lachnospirales bacterium]
MKQSEILEIITNYVEPLTKEVGAFIYDVELVKEGSNLVLRIYIDKNGDGGVGITECEVVSRGLIEKLDENDPIEKAYTLEVSSPGVERKLRTPTHFERYINEDIYVKTYKGVDSKKEFIGKLLSYENEVIKVETIDKTYEFTKDEVALCRLYVTFK